MLFYGILGHNSTYFVGSTWGLGKGQAGERLNSAGGSRFTARSFQGLRVWSEVVLGLGFKILGFLGLKAFDLWVSGYGVLGFRLWVWGFRVLGSRLSS